MVHENPMGHDFFSLNGPIVSKISSLNLQDIFFKIEKFTKFDHHRRELRVVKVTPKNF